MPKKRSFFERLTGGFSLDDEEEGIEEGGGKTIKVK